METANDAMEAPKPKLNSTWDDLRLRATSSAALVVIAAVCIGFGGVLFMMLAIFCAVQLMKEWEDVTRVQPRWLQYAGYLLMILPCACLIWLRDVDITLVIVLIAVISATDMGAYFVGKRFGTHKIAPRISPQKSWEGLAGGILGAVIISILFSPYVHVPHNLALAVGLGIAAACLAQMGDFFKSWLKRQAGMKDSGTLIPGHGGLLDRFDGYLFTTPLFALLISLAL